MSKPRGTKYNWTHFSEVKVEQGDGASSENVFFTSIGSFEAGTFKGGMYT